MTGIAPKPSPQPLREPSPGSPEGGALPEVYGPPRFLPGQKVRATVDVRNDGTLPGLARGDRVVAAGDVGFVTRVGEFLQRYYVYTVDFLDRDCLIGMRGGEIESLEDSMKVTIGRRGEKYSAYVAKKDLEETIVATQRPQLWGGWVELSNGWRLDLPDMAAGTRLPVTVTARRLADSPA